MLPAPFRYPFRGERAVDALLVGGALHLLTVYVPVVPLIPLVPVLGYLLVVFAALSTREPADRFDSLPAYPGVRSVLRTGLRGAVVVASFLVPATVVLLVTVAGASQLTLTPGDVSAGTSVAFALGSTTSLLLAVVCVYLLPAALANFLANGRILAAYDTDVLARAAGHGAYFYDVLVGLVAGAVLLTVAGATVSVAVGFFVAFYAELVAVGFWSRGVSRALPDVVAAA
ncbi:DUF4013 domain-containing protein [Halobacterium jilantaiense]|uniref:DUF4013 domain-containing protein n=1 Tax=Halobacterium jilantaiense TaxID=355548 RepID=A0A1I0MN48_9EURY|nr:DUF4013 domain-containing protein [Halobacterium jilantaiense]SEV89843.1 Protein of unknown function [Halobacterium jilantaiense]